MNTQDIDIFISRYLTGEASEEEKVQLEKWRKDDPENEKYFHEFETVWQLASLEYRLGKQVVSNTDKAWEKIRPKEVSKTKSVSWTQHLWWVAATIVIGLSAALLIFTQDTTIEMMKVSAKKVEEITLPDGTHVTLNKGSLLEYPQEFSGADRLVRLEGQAFFDVKRDPASPFIVDMTETQVKVLGTSFNIHSNPENREVEVYVTSGKVALIAKEKTNAKQKQIELEKGDIGVFLADKKKFIKETPKTANKMAWKTKTFQFDATPLPFVLEDLSLAYDVSFVIENTDLDNCTLTMSVQTPGTLKEMITAIELAMGITIEKKGIVYFVNGSCEE
ncbi:FecR domain-containing protein [Limibacter armeniacum]|uniref:FecR domain-containing protein n=1 Tax=Limibacter armeniacum TaxID=466084 RepID=UPI002FE6121B